MEHPLATFPPRDRDVAVVFQSYALYPHMTVYENIAFPLRMKKQSPIQIGEEVKKVAEFLGLNHTLQRKPKELSGGQRQRVALGRAIIRKPRLFLLDEPLSNLDAQLRTEMRSELKKLHQRLKITMIYVTHDQAEAMTLSDRMAILHEGTLQQCGIPQTIYESPKNLFVAKFIGSPPMNTLQCEWNSTTPGTINLGENVSFSISPLLVDQMNPEKISKKRILLGIRPENITLTPDGLSKGFSGRISVVEPMGSESWIEIIFFHHSLKVKAPPHLQIKPGQTITFNFQEEKIHFFDPDTGLRVA